MTGLTEILFVAILGVDLLLVAASRLLHCIRLVAVQGFLLGILPLVMWNWTDAPPHAELIFIAAVNIGLKGLVLPWLLARTMRSAHVCRELEPMIGYSFSILIALLITGGSFLFCRNIDWTGHSASLLSAPVAFSMGGSQSTANIFKAWCRMLGGQVFLLLMNAWCLRLFTSMVGTFIANPLSL